MSGNAAKTRLALIRARPVTTIDNANQTSQPRGMQEIGPASVSEEFTVIRRPDNSLESGAQLHSTIIALRRGASGPVRKALQQEQSSASQPADLADCHVVRRG
ncbi:uncharacterized protein DFL_002149 [Arthrobotrys flagrans]|uniref:Uncharacterized protein n=1 Tax=Arthrobotrys flagrans TaxID=97331 RepID=A0A437AAQ4_ARTFL|nr:hypothetical protein DFL_002149 [Arthrobotrys flagrans]